MKTTGFAIRLLILFCMSHIVPTAFAQKPATPAPPPDPTTDPLVLSAGFLTAHPDLRYRLLGLQEMKRGKFEDALRFFRRAAFYADKPSQGMVAEMLWNGQGIERNPSLAYAWMDLAAERGYAGFMGLRERYWNALTAEQRSQALAQGQEIYAMYGDAAAQPRLAIVLRRERRRLTGSRTGFAGNVQIYIPGPGGFEQIDGTKFYDERYWDPKQYQAWHDSIWMKPRVGRVSVGEMEQIREGEKSNSRIPAIAPQTDAREPATPERDEDGLGIQKDI
jgi:uncharacterized protein